MMRLSLAFTDQGFDRFRKPSVPACIRMHRITCERRGRQDRGKGLCIERNAMLGCNLLVERGRFEKQRRLRHTYQNNVRARILHHLYHGVEIRDGDACVLASQHIVAYGRRGSTLTVGTKTEDPVSLAEATKVFDKLIASKLAKGYQSGFPGRPYRPSPSSVQVQGSDSGIRCQLLNSVDEGDLSRLLTGNYPNYRQVIPPEFLTDATIPETHRPALISWLRSLDGKNGHGATVRLTWNKPGHLTLTLQDSDSTATHIQVPVSIAGEGKPPVIAFAPGFLADALEIGPTLRLIDGLSPGMTSDSSGTFCVIMPCRCVAEAVNVPEVGAE